VKITPINYTAQLEPELIKFWRQRERVSSSGIEVQRSHNLKLQRTAISFFKALANEESTLLCHLEVSNIPQQQNNAALNCLIHMPGIELPQQLLMVFKLGSESSMWNTKIIERIESMLSSLSDAQDRAQAAREAQAKAQESPPKPADKRPLSAPAPRNPGPPPPARD
jgi:hypothetical protein